VEYATSTVFRRGPGNTIVIDILSQGSEHGAGVAS